MIKCPKIILKNLCKCASTLSCVLCVPRELIAPLDLISDIWQLLTFIEREWWSSALLSACILYLSWRFYYVYICMDWPRPTPRAVALVYTPGLIFLFDVSNFARSDTTKEQSGFRGPLAADYENSALPSDSANVDTDKRIHEYLAAVLYKAIGRSSAIKYSMPDVVMKNNSCSRKNCVESIRAIIQFFVIIISWLFMVMCFEIIIFLLVVFVAPNLLIRASATLAYEAWHVPENTENDRRKLHNKMIIVMEALLESLFQFGLQSFTFVWATRTGNAGPSFGISYFIQYTVSAGLSIAAVVSAWRHYLSVEAEIWKLFSLTEARRNFLSDIAEHGLDSVDADLQKDRKCVTWAVRKDGEDLRYADEPLKKDKEVVLEAVKRNGPALQYADESLKKDKEVVLQAVKQDGLALQYADESLKKNQEIVLEAVKQFARALRYADESLKKDKEVVIQAVYLNGWALEYADELLKKDKEVVLQAVKRDGRALIYADESLKKDKEVVLQAVKQNGWALGYADESLKKDKEFVLQAVELDGWALEYADESLKKDKEVVLQAVKENGPALQYAHESLKKDKEVVFQAVKQSGWALGYADESLKKDKEFVLQAVKLNGWALGYADESLRKDIELVFQAVKRDGRALHYADESLKEDKEVVLQAVQRNALALQYAHESHKKDKEVVLQAVKQDGLALQYADESLKKDKGLVP